MRTLLLAVLLLGGCATHVVATADDASVLPVDASRDSPEASLDPNGCNIDESDRLALVMLQQYASGSYIGQLPTTTLARVPSSGGWTEYEARVTANQSPSRALGYTISACSFLRYAREQSMGVGWMFSFSATAEGQSGRGLLTSEWDRREGIFDLIRITAGFSPEIRKGTEAARTIGVLSNAFGRTSFEETWWVFCVPPRADPNRVDRPDGWRPVISRTGSFARCENRPGL